MSPSENNDSEKSQLQSETQYSPSKNVRETGFVKHFKAAVLFLLVFIALAVIAVGIGVFQLLQHQSLSETDANTGPTTTTIVNYSSPATIGYVGTPVLAFRSNKAFISYTNGQKEINWSFDGTVSADTPCSFLFEDKIYLLGRVLKNFYQKSKVQLSCMSNFKFLSKIVLQIQHKNRKSRENHCL